MGLGLELGLRLGGGGLPRLDPRAISGLVGWWDFSDPTTLYTDSGTTLVSADGDVIGQANEKSGNGHHLRQADNTMRGTYQTAEKAGRSVLRTDGVNDCYTCISAASAFKFLQNGPSTVFMVVKIGLVANPNTLYWLLDNVTLAGSIGSRNGYYIRYDDRAASSFSDAYVHIVANNNNAIVNNVANDRAPTQTWVVNSIVSDPTNGTAANRSFIRKNGLDPISNNASTTAISSTADPSYALALGAAAGDGGNPVPADWGEVLIYNRALPDNERAAIGNYLLGKWAIS